MSAAQRQHAHAAFLHADLLVDRHAEITRKLSGARVRRDGGRATATTRRSTAARVRRRGRLPLVPRRRAAPASAARRAARLDDGRRGRRARDRARGAQGGRGLRRCGGLLSPRGRRDGVEGRARARRGRRGRQGNRPRRRRCSCCWTSRSCASSCTSPRAGCGQCRRVALSAAERERHSRGGVERVWETRAAHLLRGGGAAAAEAEGGAEGGRRRRRRRGGLARSPPRPPRARLFAQSLHDRGLCMPINIDGSKRGARDTMRAAERAGTLRKGFSKVGDETVEAIAEDGLLVPIRVVNECLGAFAAQLGTWTDHRLSSQVASLSELTRVLTHRLHVAESRIAAAQRDNEKLCLSASKRAGGAPRRRALRPDRRHRRARCPRSWRCDASSPTRRASRESRSRASTTEGTSATCASATRRTSRAFGSTSRRSGSTSSRRSPTCGRRRW